MALKTAFLRTTSALILLGVVCVVPVGGQVLNSVARPISLQAVLPESLTVTLSASAVNFTLTPGSATNSGSTSITATTSWTLAPGLTPVRVYAFFANSASALTDGAGDNIPSADFQISDNGGAFRALVRTVPFGGTKAGLQLSSTPIRAANRSGSHTDTLNFNINLTALPNLPPATYTGTLTIQAQAL